MKLLTAERRRALRIWSPAFLAAGATWLLLMTIGGTPLARACGLALAIFGVTASMRPMGFVASTAGGLTLALCPVFWSQAGGGGPEPAAIVIAAALALIAMLASAIFLKRRHLGIGLGIGVFVILFWSQIGTPQSLRLTGLVSAWLVYLLVDMIMLTNPRPGIKPAKAPKYWQPLGLLLLLAIGAANDPLVVLFAPAILLALFLSYARLPAWYWIALTVTIGAGLALLARTYGMSQPPAVDIWGWREAPRWIELGQLIIAQFSLLGIVLGVIGLARLARWYPPLGVVTMFAYAAFFAFGLVYLGRNREILLLPLLIIQVMWMTYAVNTFGQWVNKSLENDAGLWIHLVSALYFIVPALLLLNIMTLQV